MLTRISAFLMIAVLAGGCVPHYEGESSEIGRRKILGTVREPVEDVQVGDVLILVDDWSSEPVSSRSVRVTAIMRPAPGRFEPFVADLSRAQIRALTVPEIREALKEHGYQAGDETISSREAPCYSNEDGPGCHVIHRDVLGTDYLVYNDVAVQLVHGVYGNRRGSEFEHMYEVESDGTVRSGRALQRDVDYDYLPDWW